MTEVIEDIQGEILESFDAIMQRCQGAPWILPNGYPIAQSLECVMQGDTNPTAMSASFCIVTRGKGVNRQGNKLVIAPNGKQQGLNLESYKTNPVVFLDHGQRGLTLPIGVSEDPSGNCTVKLFNGKADATVYFSQVLPEGALIYGLVEEGILRTSSISFMPMQAMALPQRDRLLSKEKGDGSEVYDVSPGRWGMDFIASDMLEWSIVGIPADAGAVRKFLDRGDIHGEKLTQRMKYAMTQMAGPAPCWSPGWTAPVAQSQPVAKVDAEAIMLRVEQSLEKLAVQVADLDAKLVDIQAQKLEMDVAAQVDVAVHGATNEESLGVQLAAMLQQELAIAVAPVQQNHEILLSQFRAAIPGMFTTTK